jgi:hypothetical protein
LGAGLADGADEVFGGTTGTAFFDVLAVPSLLDETILTSIVFTFCSFEIGIKKVATFPEILPASLVTLE